MESKLFTRFLKTANSQDTETSLKCPTSHFSQCSWEGTPRDLFNHCRLTHSDFFVEDNAFEVSLSRSYVRFNFVQYHNRIFLTKTKCTGNSLLFSIVQCNAPETAPEEYLCVLTVSTEDRQLSEEVAPEAEDTGTYGTNVDIQSLRSDGRLESVTVKMEISEKKFSSKQLVDVDLILSQLECPICCNSMTPPIFLCLGGHSVCNNCKNNVNGSCPFCRKIVTSSRNYTMEEIARLPIHTCKFEGCDFVANFIEVCSHEIFCMLGDDSLSYCFFDCLGCKTKASKRNLLRHMQEDHSRFFRSSNPVRVKGDQLVSGVTSLFVVRYFQRLFKLKLKFVRPDIFISLWVDAPWHEVHLFEYGVSIFERERLLFKSPGLTLNDNNKIVIRLDFLQFENICYDDLMFEIFVVKYNT